MSQRGEQITNVLDTFDHVVVLMLENRSFDSLLGYLYPRYPVPSGQQFEGVDGKNLSNPIPLAFQFTDRHGKPVTEVPVARITGVDLKKNGPPYPDPGEDYPHVNTQLFNLANAAPDNQPPYNLPSPLAAPAMTGFVSDYIQNYIHTEFPNQPPPAPDAFYEKYKFIMESYHWTDLPVLSGLAREFAVFDHWFCSIPSETICNRNFWHAGTSWGHVINPGPADDPGDQDNWPNTEAWLQDTAGATLFSQLAASNIRWKIYSDNKIPLCASGAGIACRIFRLLCRLAPDWFRQFLKTLCDSKVGQIWFVKGICDSLRSGELSLPVTPLLHLLNFARFFESSHSDIFNTLEGFRADCAKGRLPAYSFVEPNFFNPHNDMHPSTPGESIDGAQKTSPVLLGEALVRDVYNAIFTSPRHRENTLLIITFDEHGGCYDHVAPPGQYGYDTVPPATIAAPPDLTGYTQWDGFDFSRLGLRVPMIMVSPWIKRNTIINTPMSHTSFLKTVHEKWGLPSLSARENASPCFHDSGLLSLSQPRRKMPVLPRRSVPLDVTDYSRAKMPTLAKTKMSLLKQLWCKAFPEDCPPGELTTHEDAAAFFRHAIPKAKARLGRADALTGRINELDGVLVYQAIARELTNRRLR
jgi:phospholipase C